MAQTLAIVHTSPTLTPMFSSLCAAHIPDVQVFHMVDESLIKDTIRSGQMRRVTLRRVLALLQSAQDSGADAILVTCSSIGRAVALAQQILDVPVIRVDEAMAEKAVRMGTRIGVAATLRTTLEPTLALLRDKAAAAGREIELVPCLADRAFEAVLSGDTDTHDRILSQALRHEMPGVELIVLAQASMARVVSAMGPGALPVPVLSSPELAVMAARDALRSVRTEELVEAGV